VLKVPPVHPPGPTPSAARLAMARQALYQQAPCLVDSEGIGSLESELPAVPVRSTLKRKIAAAIGLLGIGAAAANLLGRSPPLTHLSFDDDRKIELSLEASATLLKSDVECNSKDEDHGYVTTAAACAEKVRAAGGAYFIYGKGSKKGACWLEKTSDETCPEGFEKDSYDFFKVNQATSTDPCNGFAFVDMTEIIHNNLGGKGPDDGSEGMVFRGVHKKPGKPDVPILMVVNATSTYVPHDPKENGFNGKYMSINLKGNKEGTAKVHLKIKFLSPDTLKRKKLGKADFTFFDLDTARGGENTEYVMAKGFDEWDTTEKTEVKTSKDGEYMVFKASTRGTASDNPRDPSRLTIQQRNRAVMMKFTDIEGIEIELGTTKGPHTRAFNFVARPSLECGKVKGAGKSALERHRE